MKTPKTESGKRGAAVRVKRMVRPAPRTFAHFPIIARCPICGTNDDGRTVLVPIAGTEAGGLTAAMPLHLACAVAKQWDQGLAIGWTWPNAEVRHGVKDADLA